MICEVGSVFPYCWSGQERLTSIARAHPLLSKGIRWTVKFFKNDAVLDKVFLFNHVMEELTENGLGGVRDASFER